MNPKEQNPCQVWPQEGLEDLEACPVCEDPRRELLYRGMTDRVFFCAPGQWTLWHCPGCGCAYLNPRPTEKTISLAYRRYYTHDISPDPVVPGFYSRLKQAIKNDYLCAHYGAESRPRLPLGRFLPYLLGSAYPRELGTWVRHLERPMKDAVCLDVGCGNGGFFDVAHACGWRLHGLEPDPRAASAARWRGMTVYESALPRTGLRDETYDAVTMSHVIEHLHDPVSALQEVRRILKPGGTLWIGTPNVESIGHRRFGVNWRGLEPPRHLVLFSGASLAEALDRAGFGPMVALPISLRPFGMFAPSHCIAAGRDPNGSASRIPQRIRWLAVSAALRTWLSPTQGEELLVSARKPTQP